MSKPFKYKQSWALSADGLNDNGLNLISLIIPNDWWSLAWKVTQWDTNNNNHPIWVSRHLSSYFFRRTGLFKFTSFLMNRNCWVFCIHEEHIYKCVMGLTFLRCQHSFGKCFVNVLSSVVYHKKRLIQFEVNVKCIHTNKIERNETKQSRKPPQFTAVLTKMLYTIALK